MLKNKCVGTIAVILYSGLALSHPNEDHVNALISKYGKPEWFMCEKHNDCSYVSDNCNFTYPVNKTARNSLVELILKNKKQCIDLVGPNLPNGTECKDKKCSLIITKR